VNQAYRNLAAFRPKICAAIKESSTNYSGFRDSGKTAMRVRANIPKSSEAKG
jgi:hypothetical protein